MTISIETPLKLLSYQTSHTEFSKSSAEIQIAEKHQFDEVMANIRIDGKLNGDFPLSVRTMPYKCPL